MRRHLAAAAFASLASACAVFGCSAVLGIEDHGPPGDDADDAAPDTGNDVAPAADKDGSAPATGDAATSDGTATGDGSAPDAVADGGIDAYVDTGTDAYVDTGIDAYVDTGVDAYVDTGIDTYVAPTNWCAVHFPTAYKCADFEVGAYNGFTNSGASILMDPGTPSPPNYLYTSWGGSGAPRSTIDKIVMAAEAPTALSVEFNLDVLAKDIQTSLSAVYLVNVSGCAGGNCSNPVGLWLTQGGNIVLDNTANVLDTGIAPVTGAWTGRIKILVVYGGDTTVYFNDSLVPGSVVTPFPATERYEIQVGANGSSGNGVTNIAYDDVVVLTN